VEVAGRGTLAVFFFFTNHWIAKLTARRRNLPRTCATFGVRSRLLSSSALRRAGALISIHYIFDDFWHAGPDHPQPVEQLGHGTVRFGDHSHWDFAPCASKWAMVEDRITQELLTWK
jgi:hypothetical protein